MKLVKVVPLSVNPMGAVRKTQSDRWRKRPCVEAEHAYRDELRLHLSPEEIPHPYLLVFVRAFPNSWSQKKKERMVGSPCKVKPDKDNLEKCLADALFKDDAHLTDGRVVKLWGWTPEVRIFELEPLDYKQLLGESLCH
jgi:Holliday junction resolvase RusA-like endonuclease